MKKLLTLFIILCSFLILFSCSKSPMSSGLDGDRAAITLTPRPEFIETRPPAEIASAVMQASSDYYAYLEKKPPKPPPDTTSQDPNPNPAHKYAYVVGISDYEGTINDLQYPDDDALAIKSYLQGEGFSVQMDLNQNATADNIAAGLQWLAAQAEAGDEIAFYYSGHGGKAPGYGSSLISHDLYYMTHGYVMQIFNSADCTKKLVAIDCCVIGDFHQDCMSGTYMATASANTDSYDAPMFQHGAWTYFFLEAAEDLNYIYAEEIGPYAAAEMKAWARIYHLRASPKNTDMYTGQMDI
jgi:hypothetical protein